MASRRTRLAEGIYEDQYGRAGVVKVRGTQRERRFPKTTDLQIIRRWRETTRAELQDTTPRRRPATLPRDMVRRLRAIEGRPSYNSDRSHLKAWLPFLATVKTPDVRDTHVERGVSAWLKAGKSARTIRHRIRVLREFYQWLKLPSPTAGVTLPRPADPYPVPVSHDTIQQVAQSLERGKRHAKGYGSDSDVAYARFLVRATTGQRPSQIGRAQPADLQLQRRLWFVRPAKGGTMIPLPLNREAVRAWKLFIAADAWGEFDARSFSKTIRRHGWPSGVRPYNLRHTFAIDHLLAGTNLGDLQGLLGHAQIETTRKHYAPVMVALLQKAVQRRRLGGLSASRGTASRSTASRSPRTGAKAVQNRGEADANRPKRN